MTGEGLSAEDYHTLDFDDLQALVEQLRATVGAAELHGLLTAELCTAGSEPESADIIGHCIQFLGEDIEASAADRLELQAIAAQTRQGLEDSNLGFMLLLPDDEQAIALRAEALAEWCQGFMYGFAIAEKRRGLALSGDDDVAEILQDFEAISRVDTELQDDDGSGGADEEDLMQLAEYVRIAALNLYAQCSELSQQSPTRPGPGEPLTLH